ncbi:MAG: hypothetical protein Q4E01_04320, partial [Actinomycetaceae bacterium]|nr:hypothetical protein [Actinomycetaceae bacterium]
FSQAVATRVCELLHAVIGHDTSIDDVDATALIDATQYDLAATPQEYKRYRASLREEFSSLSDLEYFRARRRFVKMLLQRPQIFLSPAGAAWEATARQNLEAELANLEARIAKSDPGAPLEEDPADSPGVDLTSTTMIRRIEAAAAPVVPIKKDEDAEPAPHATAVNVSTPVAAVEEAESDDTSSLEAEPEDLTRSFAAPVRRLSAKELARLARKSKEAAAAEQETSPAASAGVEDSFTGADAKELRKQLDED